MLKILTFCHKFLGCDFSQIFLISEQSEPHPRRSYKFTHPGPSVFRNNTDGPDPPLRKIAVTFKIFATFSFFPFDTTCEHFGIIAYLERKLQAISQQDMTRTSGLL